MLSPPSKLGIPYDSWRTQQSEAIAKVLSSDDNYLLELPTGIGKTGIGVAIPLILCTNALYLVATKYLQDQVTSTFPMVKTVKGRRNYPCWKYPGATAEVCDVSAGVPCEHSNIGCPYLEAKREAVHAQVACLNYDYFLYEANYVHQFSGRPLMVVDEADLLAGKLQDFVSLKITARQRRWLGDPAYKTKPESWLEWGKRNLGVVQSRLDELDPSDQNYAFLTRLFRKFELFVSLVDDTWVMEEELGTLDFKPVWVSKYADNYFWKHSDRFIGMSATILSPTEFGRSIGKKNWQYVSQPSPFPIANRRIIFSPVTSLSHKTETDNFPLIANAVSKILSNHPEEKGLVHTVSYDRARRLLSMVASDRLVLVDKNIPELLASDKPLFMVSPSMERGVDLPDDLCRVVIITKIPYPNLASKQVNRRLYSSPEGQKWYTWETARRLVQMSGRAVRHMEDHATTYILDSEFDRFSSAHWGLLPGWWRQAVEVKGGL